MKDTPETGLPGLTPEDIADIQEAIKQGANSPADILGLTAKDLGTIEYYALGYFKAGDYDKAFSLYHFILNLDVTYKRAWRGLGASAYAKRLYPLAAKAYEQVLLLDPEDLLLRVYHSECLCLAGDFSAGCRELEKTLAMATKLKASRALNKSEQQALERAKLILAVQGRIEPPEIPQPSFADSNFLNITEPLSEAASSAPKSPVKEKLEQQTFIPDLQRLRQNPEIRELLAQIRNQVLDGQLSYAEIAGFSEEQLESAYICACNYAAKEDYVRALQILTMLMILKPHNGPYFQLFGIIMHRQKEYTLADQYYRISLMNDAANPTTLIYRGEVCLLLGEKDRALKYLNKGLQLAKGEQQHIKLVKRAESLLKQAGVKE